MCDSTCPICHGLGFIRHDVEFGHPDFGKLFICPNNRVWDIEGITEEEGELLEFSKFANTPAITELKRHLYDLMKQGYGLLYLWGKPGSGKTLSCKAATVYARYMYGYEARYYTHISMFNWLRSSYDSDNGQSLYARRLDDIAKVRWLVIDELGRDKFTDFSRSTLSDILDRRYVGATTQRTCTVFVSNFDPKSYLDDYQVDRLKDNRFKIVEVKHASFRQSVQEGYSMQRSDWWKNLKYQSTTQEK